MKIAGYTRQSGPEDHSDSQKIAIQAWLRSNKIDPKKVEWFAEKTSGTPRPRPEFDRLQGAIFDGAVGTVVLGDFSRLSRRQDELVGTLKTWCENGICVVVLDPQLELKGQAFRTLISAMQSMSAIQLDYLNERQAAGIEEAKKKNAYTGRKPGTTKGNSQQARELRKKGRMPSEIAAELGISVRTVFRYLKH